MSDQNSHPGMMWVDVRELGVGTLDTIGVAMIVLDENGRIIFLNQNAARTTGWTTTQAFGKPVDELFSIEDESAVRKHLYTLPGHGAGSSHGFVVNRTGRRLEVEYARIPVYKGDRKSTGELVAFIQKSARPSDLLKRNREEQNKRLDPLTGLLNRIAFKTHLEREAKAFNEDKVPRTLLTIDVDHLALVNDVCGQEAGDGLLRLVAVSLVQTNEKLDIVARLSGDEFGVLLYDGTPADARRLAGRLKRRLEQLGFSWQGRSFNVSLSVGIIPFTHHLAHADDLLFAAGYACKKASEMGGGQIYMYRHTDATVKRRQQEMDIAANMKDNLRSGRFILYGQIIRPLSYSPNDLLHFEVLLRPLDEMGRLGSPASVIRAAELYGGMEHVDRWVIQQTMRTLKDWLPDVSTRLGLCSINLSGVSLKDDDLLEYIYEQIAEAAVPPRKICFEITETAAVNNISKAQWLIEGVRAIGCRCALDDFGTGMASYGYLKDLPVDFLKIDGVFIKDIATSSINNIIVESINQISHFLGIETIAEFVGSQTVFDKLRSLGVDYAQGYWTGKPMPIRELFKPDSIPPLPRLRSL